MKNVLVTLVGLTLFASCAVSKTKLTDEGEKVKVLYTKPRKGCNAVAKVTGVNENGVLDLAINHARNLAGEKGANTVVIDDKVNNSKLWKVHATGYICKKK